MNKKIYTLACVIGFTLLIVACSGAEVSPQGADKPAAVEVEDSTEMEQADVVEEKDQEVNTEEESESPSIDAGELYRSNCAGCHGQDRSGGRGPALLPDRLTGEATQYAKTISDGRSGMPSFSGKLSSEEITTLAEWILTAP